MARKRQKIPFKLQIMSTDTSPALGSLGETCKNVGGILGRQTKAGMTTRFENADCSCGGENANCFKCDGTGYYRREIVEKMQTEPASSVSKLRSGNVNSTQVEAHFSNDARGGLYGLRECGRFSSNPLHDDYDN